MEGVPDCLVHIYHVGGDISAREKAPLLLAAEFVGEWGENGIEKGCYDSIVCIHY